jgi:nucleoside-diphosphate-sugar epimerase
MQTVLVAGGAGFIGTTLCETLLKNGHKVICVDSFLTSNSSNIAHLRDDDNFRLIEHNVIEPLTLNEKIDAIFHMASPASPNHHSKISYHALPKETMLVNSAGTFNLLELALRNSAKFLFASTSEVYGDPLEHPQKEDYRGNVSTIGPRSVYDESKRFGETIVSYYGRDKNLDVRIARIFNTYGPRLLKEDMRMIIMFIYEALSNDPITIFGDGTQTRSLCYVDDTVEGLISLGLKDGLSGEVVNIGSSEEHTVLEYANLVKELTGSNSEIKFAEELPKDDPIKRKPDISRAKDILDWEPKISLEEGLQRTIQYIKSL